VIAIQLDLIMIMCRDNKNYIYHVR